MTTIIVRSSRTTTIWLVVESRLQQEENVASPLGTKHRPIKGGGWSLFPLLPTNCTYRPKPLRKWSLLYGQWAILSSPNRVCNRLLLSFGGLSSFLSGLYIETICSSVSTAASSALEVISFDSDSCCFVLVWFSPAKGIKFWVFSSSYSPPPDVCDSLVNERQSCNSKPESRRHRKKKKKKKKQRPKLGCLAVLLLFLLPTSYT